MKKSIVYAALIGALVLSGLVTAAADNISLKYDIDVRSADPAAVSYTDPGSLVIGPNFLIGIQPDWSKYTGEEAGPGGMLTLTAIYGSDSFTPNGTATDELYGSTLDLSTGTASYNSYSATQPVDFGSLLLNANPTGSQLVAIGSTAFTAAFDAGEAGTITSLFLGSPVGNLGENYVGGLGSGDDEVFSIPLFTPVVPEPSTWALLGVGLIGLYGVYRRRAQA